MKRTCLLALPLALCAPAVAAQEEPSELGFPAWHERTEFLMASPGSLKFGLYGFGNPALLSTLHQPDLLFQWSDDGGFTRLNQWGLFAAAPGVGFGMMNRDLEGRRLTDYRVSVGFDNGGATRFGIGYGWVRGAFDLDSQLTLGALVRPSPYLSVGLVGSRGFGGGEYEGVVDIGVRPLGTERVALFGEAPINSVDGFSDVRWSAGAALEPLPGVRITTRYTDDIGVTAGVQLSLGHAGLGTQAHLDTGGNHRFNTYGLRLGAYDRNVRDSHFPARDTYLDLDLRGSAPHQRARLFDTRETLQEKLDALEAARRDPRIAGVVVDAREMGLTQGQAWEVGSALGTLRREGKSIVLYVERGGMNLLHLIAAADHVVMDPYGGLAIPGFLIGRTYLAELLTEGGIGVDEFREMEYKSGFEVFSRTDMSEPAREQNQALVDGFYELVRRNLSEGRGLPDGTFDALVEDGIWLPARELVETGLVDRLARPDDLDAIIEELAGEGPRRIDRTRLLPYLEPGDHRWGPRPEVGLLYAIGPTLLESGIRARTLAREIRSFRERPNMRALVLRVDSPGGDALASDLVAQELRKTAEEMPVIVSMGDLGASGGYWISMYADTIVALPNTITGSIGVIGGWFYDAGLSDRLHLNVDEVQRGRSADAFFGPTLPLIGLQLPGRNLTEEERAQLIGNLNALYEDFIDKVAEGRGMESDDVRQVAAGRVWTGEDALDAGLVDELGSLTVALRIARQAAGISEEERFTVIEGPEPPLLRLSTLLSLLGVTGPDEPDLVQEYLEMVIRRGGEPMPVLPFEYMHWQAQMGNRDRD